MTWTPGDPPRHGYYLATWVTEGGRRTVSELWFNPDAARGKWWSSRGYLGQRGQDADNQGVVEGVLAHMALPAPYEP